MCHLPVIMHCLCTQCLKCAILRQDDAMLFEAAAYGSYYQGTSAAACNSSHHVKMLGYTSWPSAPPHYILHTFL